MGELSRPKRNLKDIFGENPINWYTPMNKGASVHCFPSSGGKSLCGRYRIGDRDQRRTPLAAPKICNTCLEKYRKIKGNSLYLPPYWEPVKIKMSENCSDYPNGCADCGWKDYCKEHFEEG